MENYTAIMSHEFRTPLATSVMLLDMVFKHVRDETAIELLLLVNTSLNLLLSLVHNIVDLKLIKAGHILAESAIFNPIEVTSGSHF
jgi:signal transduction histidine kinase